MLVTLHGIPHQLSDPSCCANCPAGRPPCASLLSCCNRHDVRQRTNAAVTGASDGAGTIYRSASQAWSEAFPRGQWSNQVMQRTKT